MRARAAALVVGAGLVLTAAPSHASTTGGLAVTAVGAPVWASGRELPVRVVVRNAQGVLCDSILVTLRCRGQRSGSVTVAEPGLSGTWTGTLAVPARDV